MNIAIIEQGYSKYLFEVPESISLKEGEKVKCDTKRGVTDGTVWADSVTTDEPTAKLIGKLLGAKFPLKSVVGKTVTSVEMFEQPELKQEPVKLYCVADGSGVRSIKKGDICEFLAPHFRFPNGEIYPYKYSNVDDFCTRNPSYAKANFVPLVSRPAKVGEWVYVTHTDYLDDLKVGDIAKVRRVNAAGSVYISESDSCHQNGLNYGRGEYLVLDGYKPEPEKAEPEYYSGKVVCVDNGGGRADWWDIGKVYGIVGGVIRDNDGTPRVGIESAEQLNIALEVSGAKFIEFKGE